MMAGAGAAPGPAAPDRGGRVPTLLHVFPTFGLGGAQVRFVRIANRFGAAYRHRIVSLDGGTDALRLLKETVDVQLLDPPLRKGDTWGNLWRIRQVLRALRPDWLITSNWGSIEWALANLVVGGRHLHMEDGFGPDEATGQLARRVWTRWLALRRALVMLPSETLLDIARHHWRLPSRRLLHIPNGIDCDRFGAAPPPGFAAGLGLEAGGPLIGTVASLRPEKALDRLIAAFAAVPAGLGARLAIVGDGGERARLAAQAGALGVAERVIFTGACPTPEYLLPSFSLFALSSDTEQMPLSVLEAMAAGLPVVATRVGDISRMVAEENRPFVVDRDPARLAEACAALLADPHRARAIGHANAVRARRVYHQEIMFAAYRRIFDGVEPSPAGR